MIACPVVKFDFIFAEGDQISTTGAAPLLITRILAYCLKTEK